MRSVFGGWQPKDLVILAARPSIGKTTLMLHAVHEASRHGVAVFLQRWALSSSVTGSLPQRDTSPCTTFGMVLSRTTSLQSLALRRLRLVTGPYTSTIVRRSKPDTSGQNAASSSLLKMYGMYRGPLGIVFLGGTYALAPRRAMYTASCRTIPTL
jgi:DnaB-like helicase C terminal domain